MQGKALASGAAGDRILVANERSGRRLEGIVGRDGTVTCSESTSKVFCWSAANSSDNMDVKDAKRVRERIL